MSVQFGRWNYDGRPVDPDYLEKAKAVLSPYGPDDCGSYRKSGICIRHLAFHTTKESRRERQPQICPFGAVLTWDGRLDNREELINRFREVLTADSTDVSIVAAAYEAWGTNCFAKLIGDWAVSIWNPNDRSLILAKDFVGTRHLYYSIDEDQVTWSTILDPLILLAERTFALEEEYIAGWLGFFPATHLTPYVGIHSVPPCCSVLIRAGAHTVRKYWDFEPVQNSNRSATCITRLSVSVRVYTPKESGLSIRLLMDIVSKRTLLVTLNTSHRKRRLTRSVIESSSPNPRPAKNSRRRVTGFASRIHQDRRTERQTARLGDW